MWNIKTLLMTIPLMKICVISSMRTFVDICLQLRKIDFIQVFWTQLSQYFEKLFFLNWVSILYFSHSWMRLCWYSSKAFWARGTFSVGWLSFVDLEIFHWIAKDSNFINYLRDFVIQEESTRGFPNFINLVGIESPGSISHWK